MAIVSFLDLMRHAHQHRYALSVTPVASLDYLEKVLTAAQALRAPLVIAPLADVNQSIHARMLFAACETAARETTIPISILGSQGSETAELSTNINLGCQAVHITPTRGEFPEAVAQVKAMTQVAKQCGIATGGSLGSEPGLQEVQAPQSYTPVAEAVALADRTEVDFLEVHIGTHSYASGSRPKIDFERLKRINEGTAVPLMVRTGENLSSDQAHRLRDHGISLVYHSHQQEEPDSDLIQHRLKFWGSAGRATEVLALSQPWALVEHIIEFNVQADAVARVDELLKIGHAKLSTIPGVRNVVAGKSVTDQAKYRFCWIITFANRKVMDYYRDHPIHVEYANTHFRPVAADRITIDFAHFSS